MISSCQTLFIGSAIALASFALGESRWSQSYAAGYIDQSGAYAGGSEIMHLVAHKGKMYAANGYWVDARWVIPPEGERQSAQVLRLDQAAGEWQVDLDSGRVPRRRCHWTVCRHGRAVVIRALLDLLPAVLAATLLGGGRVRVAGSAARPEPTWTTMTREHEGERVGTTRTTRRLALPK